jgi:hypothetical protein
MLCRVDLVRTDVSEELYACIIRKRRIGELGTTTYTVFLRGVRQLVVTVNVVPSSPILVTMMMGAICSSETSVLTRGTQRDMPEDGILHSYRRENLKSYIALTGWILQQRRNVSPVKYELGFYIPEDDILHSHRREYLKPYIALTGWTLSLRRNVSPVKYELGSYISEGGILHSHRR